MSQPISFTVKPPTSAPYRPSPLGNGGSSSRGAPSRKLFEQNGHGSDDDDDEGYGSSSRRSNKPKDERIDGFGNGRAIGGEKPSGPLVIPALPNKDWRASATANSSRTPSYKPETRDPNEKVETHERTGDGPQRSGLRKKGDETDYNDGYSNVKIKAEPIEEDENVKLEAAHREVVEQVKQEQEQESDVKPQIQTLEEQALQAILTGEVKIETEEERLRRELIIGGSNGSSFHMTEEDAFKRDIDELPEESTIEDYAAIPVSAFGEAMARGMGWNPNSKEGTKIHEPKLRPALLGLGATALEKPLPPSRNGSSSSSKKQPKVHKRDSMKYNLGESIIKKERQIEGSSRSNSDSPAPSNGNGTRERESRKNSPDSDYSSSYSKRRRDEDYSERDRDRDRDSKRYETEEERSRRKAKERERGNDYETEEERARRKAKEREREYETEEERAKRKAKERERYDSDRERGDRDRDRSRDDRDRRYRDDRDRDRRDVRDRRR